MPDSCGGWRKSCEILITLPKEAAPPSAGATNPLCFALHWWQVAGDDGTDVFRTQHTRWGTTENTLRDARRRTLFLKPNGFKTFYVFFRKLKFENWNFENIFSNFETVWISRIPIWPSCFVQRNKLCLCEWSNDNLKSLPFLWFINFEKICCFGSKHTQV